MIARTRIERTVVAFVQRMSEICETDTLHLMSVRALAAAAYDRDAGHA